MFCAEVEGEGEVVVLHSHRDAAEGGEDADAET